MTPITGLTVTIAVPEEPGGPFLSSALAQHLISLIPAFIPLCPLPCFRLTFKALFCILINLSIERQARKPLFFMD